MTRVIITGFMGTGKTEVGRRLARALGQAFVDTDGLIEAAAGRSVSDIFATDGEAGFRALEREAVEQACAMSDTVIATGGGTLLDPENRRRLAATGLVVCLTASPEEIARRVGNDSSRPLLTGQNGSRLARIRALLAERAPVYSRFPHSVDTTGLSVDEVVERLRALVAGS